MSSRHSDINSMQWQDTRHEAVYIVVIVKNAQYSVHGSTEISSEGFRDFLSTHHLVTASNGVSSAGPGPDTASCFACVSRIASD